MRFCSFTEELRYVKKAIVDGNDCGAGLELSHWPDNLTPIEIKSDLSVEICLRLASHPNREQYLDGIDIVTNNHFDCDGLLAIYSLLNPKESLENSSALIRAAEASDFYEFTSPASLQFDLIVRSFNDRNRCPIRLDANTSPSDWDQICTEALLSELPELLYDTDRYRNLWAEPYSRCLENLQFARSGKVNVAEYPEESLTVVKTTRELDHFSRNHVCQGQRILEIVEIGSSKFFTLFYREYLWYDIVSRSVLPRHKLSSIARRLEQMESNKDGRWAITEWNPALRRIIGDVDEKFFGDRKAPACLSNIPEEKVIEIVRFALNRLDSEYHFRSVCSSKLQSFAHSSRKGNKSPLPLAIQSRTTFS